MVNPTEAAKVFYNYAGKFYRATAGLPTLPFEELPEHERQVLETSARMAVALLLADLSQSLIKDELPSSMAIESIPKTEETI